jgi:hypothetical protein
MVGYRNCNERRLDRHRYLVRVACAIRRAAVARHQATLSRAVRRASAQALGERHADARAGRSKGRDEAQFGATRGCRLTALRPKAKF